MDIVELPRSLQRFFRETVVHPEGGLFHDADCEFWNVRVCTCGLLHALIWYPEDASRYYPSFGQERAEQESVIKQIHEQQIKPRSVDGPPLDVPQILNEVFGDEKNA